MEKNLLNAPTENDMEVVYSEYAEVVLNKALNDFRKEQIRKEIDRSLLERNKEEFMRLTEELKSIS